MITATMVRDAKMQGEDTLAKLLAKIPSIETATIAETDAFMLAMERIPA